MKHGEDILSHGNLNRKEIEKTIDFEVIKLFLKQKVPLGRILKFCSRFKEKVLRKGMQDLNVEVEATMEGTA